MSACPASARIGHGAGESVSRWPRLATALALLFSLAAFSPTAAVGQTPISPAESERSDKSGKSADASTRSKPTDAEATEVGDFANAEAFAHTCIDSLGERASTLRQVWAPDGRCGRRWGSNAGRRASDIYTERYLAIRSEMGLLPADQLQAFCEALITQPC